MTMSQLFALLRSISVSEVFLLLLILLVYECTLWLRRRTGQAWLNPTLLSTLLLIGYLLISHTPYAEFQRASSYLTFWLQPAVVCLAVPLYTQWQKIQAQWLPIVISQLLGSVVGIISGVGLVRLMGASDELAVAMAAKSVTMAVAIEVTNSLNGVVGLNAATVLLAGVLGQMMGVFILHRAWVRRPMSVGLAMGTASHALGTLRVMQMSERYVAYATVGLIMNGILTAFLAPMLVPWILRW